MVPLIFRVSLACEYSFPLIDLLGAYRDNYVAHVTTQVKVKDSLSLFPCNFGYCFDVIAQSPLRESAIRINNPAPALSSRGNLGEDLSRSADSEES